MNMEVSIIGSSQVSVGRNYCGGFCYFNKNMNSKICNLKSNGSKMWNFGLSQCLRWPSKSACISLRASATSQTGALISEGPSITKPINGVKLYVGLPVDTVSNGSTVNHVRAIAAGLKALKLLGVDSVELPMWWGIVEREAMGKYDWTGYLAIVEMVQKLGLKLHVSLCFHNCVEHKIPLPKWVSRVGESDPSIYYIDCWGQQYKGCLSLAVDDLPVFNGTTPVEVYKKFCDNFKTAFSAFMGSTITGISIGLGPDGELRYPSHHHNIRHRGAGEFQCYDKNMLKNLKEHAEKQGSPLWGLGGPHDAPGYEHIPTSSGFFTENGGSWESQYGNFFLSWYSSLLISHGDRILSLAASTFKDVPITISGRVPLMHSWYKSHSHPSELTAGFYNTANRDGYKAVAEIFSRNACKMIIPGIDLSDEHQPVESCSSPESLFEQIKSSCRRHGVEVSGQNLLDFDTSRSFEQIKKNLLDEHGKVDLFAYPRMGAYFFSPEHFPSFTLFVRCLKQPIQSLDDLQPEGDGAAESLHGMNHQMQAA